MKFNVSKLSVGFFALFASFSAIGHPSSGIIVNEQNEVFFVHTTRGVAKLDQDGKLSYIQQAKGGHWLCLDRQGSFSQIQPKHFLRITPDGVRPAIIFAEGGAPIAVCTDGNLYYGSGWGGGHEHEPGGATVSRLSPDGTISALPPRLKEVLSKGRGGVTGLAAGPNGSLYVASATGILKLGADGVVTSLVEEPELSGCDARWSQDGLPGFRGLDVSTNGTVFVAANGCRSVVKISPKGVVESVLKSEPPWSPTGVAIHATDLYVLEWTHPNTNWRVGWRPRVRKLTEKGVLTTLVTIEENATFDQ